MMVNEFVKWINQNPFAGKNEAREAWVKLCCQTNNVTPTPCNVKVFERLFDLDGVFLFNAQRALEQQRYSVRYIV